MNMHLSLLGSYVIEPVAVGVLFKNGPVFAEFRPRKKWVAVTFMHPEKLSSDRFGRKVMQAGGKGARWYHVVNVESTEQVDSELKDWLTEAYFNAGD